MNIDLVRKIDRWCGVPLCFLLSILNSVVSFFWRARPSHRPIRKILFIKFSELGAIILSFPLMARLKREYPDAQFYFLTFKKNQELFHFMKGIVPEENLCGIRESPLGFVLDTLKALIRFRKEDIDVIFDLEFFSRVSALLAYFIHAPKRVGFDRYTFEGLYRGNLMTHRVFYNPLIHVTRNFLSLGQEVQNAEKISPELHSASCDTELVFPAYVPDGRVREKLLQKFNEPGKVLEGKNVFLVNPGEGMLPLREWPLECFIELTRLILRDPAARVIMIGMDGASGKADRMMDAVADPRCFSLVGRTSLEDLLELFSMSGLLISNDCGLAHLAMLTRLRTITLFGPESPKVFGPLTKYSRVVYADWPCSPCLSAFNHRDSACRDNVCLKSITAADVFRLISEQS
jgi:ADP-heptose:LPS heptosyltransferase